MKASKAVLTGALAAMGLGWGAPASSAQELYNASVSLVSIATNQAGGIAYHTLGNRDLVKQCAAEHGVTNLTNLSLRYDRTANALEVVTNQTLLCKVLSFGDGVTVGNTNKTRFERLEWVFIDSGTTANGTLAATERYRYGTNGMITAFGLTGRLQYASPAAGTNGPVIYTGSIVAGSGFIFEHEGDHEGDHDVDGRSGRPGRGHGHD